MNSCSAAILPFFASFFFSEANHSRRASQISFSASYSFTSSMWSSIALAMSAFMGPRASFRAGLFRRPGLPTMAPQRFATTQPVVVPLGAYTDLAADHRRERHHERGGDEVGRNLHTLGRVLYPAPEGIGQHPVVELGHRWQVLG